jgi:predicted nucleic acid-binding protein
VGVGRGCVSVQVLEELFVTLTRKTPRRLDVTSAVAVTEDFAQWTVHAPRSDDVIAAARLNERFQISFWDAMILQSAISLRCDIVYSENLNAGQHYNGVRVVDPFV